MKNPTIKALKKNKIPLHVAIIMDGNGRWAAKRHLPRSAGHKVGVEALKDIITACIELDIKYLTVYSFSSENWQRPEEEVNFLLDLFLKSLKEELGLLDKNGVRIRLIGSRKGIPPDVMEAFRNAEKKTAKNNKLFFNIAFNYGARKEIVDAARKIYKEAERGNINIDKLDEDSFNEFLYTGGCPDPDLLIRTSGEYRLSNFLLWQLAYSEFYFVKKLWPDFGEKDLLKAVYYYQRRNRRFGKV
ncbi:MAG: isoprenyl transferase [Actinomycetota bacterium]|nr:isoprenyl transferase [Actinomycetota bacterium]